MEIEALAGAFASHNQQVVELIRKANASIDQQSGRLQEVEQMMVRRGSAPAGDFARKTLGAEVIESAEFKSYIDAGARGTGRVLITKALSTLTTAAGGALVSPDYRPDIIGMPRRRMRVRDLLAQGETSAGSVTHPLQLSRTNTAAPVAETAAKPESAMTFELISSPVRTIATWVPLSRQLMDDSPGLASFLNGELTWMIDDTEERELLAGDGTGQHLLGLIPSASAYSAPIVITDETLVDRIAAAAAQAQIASELPAEAVVLNPADVLKIQLLKDGDGRYLTGGPGGPLPTKLWGLDIVATTAVDEGDYLVGNFSSSAQIFDRMGLEIILSTEASYPGPSSTTVNAFTSNMVVCRAEKRLALAVKRPAALVAGTLPA